FRCVSKFAQVLSAAVQGRLDGRKGNLHDVADLLERISQNILQYHSATLGHWKMHEGPQADGHGLPILNWSCRIDDHVDVLVGVNGLLAGSATQKVECGVVCDAESPGFGVVDRLGLGA